MLSQICCSEDPGISPKGADHTRLKLFSALLLSRLLTSVTQSLEGELTLPVPRCFSDSEVTLYWIKGTDRVRKPFAQNCVKEIHTLWRNGPNWLPEAEDGEVDDNQEIPDECLSEMKAKDRTRVQGLLTVGSTIRLNNIFNCEDFSSID